MAVSWKVCGNVILRGRSESSRRKRYDFATKEDQGSSGTIERGKGIGCWCAAVTDSRWIGMAGETKYIIVQGGWIDKEPCPAVLFVLEHRMKVSPTSHI